MGNCSTNNEAKEPRSRGAEFSHRRVSAFKEDGVLPGLCMSI